MYGGWDRERGYIPNPQNSLYTKSQRRTESSEVRFNSPLPWGIGLSQMLMVRRGWGIIFIPHAFSSSHSWLSRQPQLLGSLLPASGQLTPSLWVASFQLVGSWLELLYTPNPCQQITSILVNTEQLRKRQQLWGMEILLWCQMWSRCQELGSCI